MTVTTVYITDFVTLSYRKMLQVRVVNFIVFIFYISNNLYRGHAVAQFVEALRYKPEGRGLDSRWCH